MDLESLTRSVAYRRQKKIPPGAVSPNMTDEQIARAILEYAQSDPGDWPVLPRAKTSKRACGAGLLGALGGGVGAVVFVIVGADVVVGANVVDNARCFGEYLYQAIFFGAILATPLGAFLGAILALRVTGRMAGTGQRVILSLATGLAVGLIIAAGYWLWGIMNCLISS
jgi:hypothetical protein